jgi:hypothetical protein
MSKKKWNRYSMNDYWAIKHANGALVCTSYSKSGAIKSFLEGYTPESRWASWKYWYRVEGARAVKVRIIEVRS